MRHEAAAAMALALVLVLPAAGSATAAERAECLQRRHAVKAERDLLQRRSLLEEALRECPEDAQLHLMLAFSLERLRKYEEALTHYAAAASLDPSLARAFFSMGDIHLLLGHFAQAVARYERGLALEPGDDRARRSLAEARAKLAAQEAAPSSP